MNRKEAEDYIFASYMKASKFQDYNKKDSEKRKPHLTKNILENLSKSVNIGVTGSKGKGSLANMISQILQTQFKVGLFTSPHIYTINERFKINGVEISDEDFVRIVGEVKKYFDPIISQLPKDECLSPIGIEAAIALTYFNENNTDINIMEFGKGAKYDDVNNVIHKYSLINSIFFEHKRELGDNIEEIARDKCMIIKRGQICAYSGKQEESLLKIIRERAREMGVPLKVYGEDFYEENVSYTLEGMKFDAVLPDLRINDLLVPLIGDYQVRNAMLALIVCKDIIKTMDIAGVRENLKKLKYPARFEIISRDPLIILDACINRKSAEEIKKSLKALKINKLTSIIGIPDDKDYFGVAKEMKEISTDIILTKSSNPHYIFTSVQRENLSKKKIDVKESSNIKEAIELAKKNCLPIIILGTTSLISESKLYFNNIKDKLF